MKKELVDLVLALLPFAIIYLGMKYKTNKLIRRFVPDGVAFAEKLDTENYNKLMRAISEVEIRVIEYTPVLYRPLVDYLINPDYIAKHIERYITLEKRK